MDSERSERFNNTSHPPDDALSRLHELSKRLADATEVSLDGSAYAATPSCKQGCPEPSSYLRLAAGAAVEDSEQLLAHASTCDPCATRLKRGLNALEGNPSPEEQAAIAELATAKAAWQLSLAEKLAASSARKRPTFFRLIPVAGTIAAGLLIAASVFAWHRQAHAPEHQLALAYSQSRTLELRIPGAEYTSIAYGNHTRGNELAQGNAPLFEARARLARTLEKSPQDSRALQLEARADVLAEHYDAAVDILDRLLAAGPVTAELLADSASAYYQRGLVSGVELDRSTALDYLRRADELAPTDPVVLFNEAIVMEDRGQLINAVEVWNRFLTIEHDAGWVAEGKRKLAALEQTLNRLKTHDSRLLQMLATPQAMDALAADAQKVALFDEELTSMQLDKILPFGYPASTSEGPASQQSRGSPCDQHCMAARRLLKSLALSLELHHNDSWLSDLLLPDVDSLPGQAKALYIQALQSLSAATRQDQTGAPSIGFIQSQQSRQAFQQLAATSPASSNLHRAAIAGEQRAVAEELLALQRTVRRDDCRILGQQYRAEPRFRASAGRYPWIQSVSQLTENICDDTPETRAAGRELFLSAERLANQAQYSILKLRIQARSIYNAQVTDDEEASDHVTLLVLRQLYAADMPPFRVLVTMFALVYTEQDSTRIYSSESTIREIFAWNKLAGNDEESPYLRMELAKAEVRIGKVKEAEKQIQIAYKESQTTVAGSSKGLDFGEHETALANLMLERGDLSRAAVFADRAQVRMRNNSDTWSQRRFKVTQGMLKLALGHYSEAADILEAGIQESEGLNPHGSAAASVEYAQLDHDLYAELAATWLAQGRSPESVLALWERFRLRSHGLPISLCPEHALDCEQQKLVARQRAMGGSILTGQILLMDRALVYRVDKDAVTWTQRPFQRRDLLDAARRLDSAVSSPLTSPATAASLGAKLSEALLPPLPSSGAADSLVLIESDPLLENLSWPVLPTSTGPLGIQYPLAEMRAFLADPSRPEDGSPDLMAGLNPRIARRTDLRPLVIGASITPDGRPPLPEALREATEVSRFLASPNLLMGQQANLSNVKASLRSADSLHFAGHAIQTAGGTRLLLASSTANSPSPWIDGALLRQYPPRSCRLAVLSACGTGVRETSWKHPMQDIVETLNSVGVPNVVATRWQIDSNAVVPLMDNFYLGLSQGKSVAVALKIARKLQFGQSQYHNPYFWGAYYVSGTDQSYLRKALYASEIPHSQVAETRQKE